MYPLLNNTLSFLPRENYSGNQVVTKHDAHTFEQQSRTIYVKGLSFSLTEPVDGYVNSPDTIEGSESDNILIVGPGRDVIKTLGGDDVVYQTEGIGHGGYHKVSSDAILLGAGDDEAGVDILDLVYPGPGSDYIEVDARDAILADVPMFDQLGRSFLVIHDLESNDDLKGDHDAVKLIISSFDELAKYTLKENKQGNVDIYYNGVEQLRVEGIEHVEIDVIGQGKPVDLSLNVRADEMASWGTTTAQENHALIRSGEKTIEMASWGTTTTQENPELLRSSEKTIQNDGRFASVTSLLDYIRDAVSAWLK